MNYKCDRNSATEMEDKEWMRGWRRKGGGGGGGGGGGSQGH